MPEEKKLGPNATFVAEGLGEYVDIFGIPFKKGQSVNVEELLGTNNAPRVLEKLARHPHFKVDGEDPSKGASKEGDAEKMAALRAASTPVIQAQSRAMAEGKEPPENYDAPLKEVLESDSRRQQQQEPPQRSSPPRGRG